MKWILLLAVLVLAGCSHSKLMKDCYRVEQTVDGKVWHKCMQPKPWE